MSQKKFILVSSSFYLPHCLYNAQAPPSCLKACIETKKYDSTTKRKEACGKNKPDPVRTFPTLSLVTSTQNSRLICFILSFFHQGGEPVGHVLSQAASPSTSTSALLVWDISFPSKSSHCRTNVPICQKLLLANPTIGKNVQQRNKQITQNLQIASPKGLCPGNISHWEMTAE